jgi:hypothetical protein
MNNETNIERIVMRRVHLICALRVVISGGVFALLLAVLMLWGVGREVWVARVFENVPHTGDFSSLISFWLSAFTHTRLVVQALILLTIASFLYFVRELARLIIGFFVLEHA